MGPHVGSNVDSNMAPIWSPYGATYGGHMELHMGPYWTRMLNNRGRIWGPHAPPQKKVRGRVDSDSDSEEFTPPDVEQSSFSRSTLEKRWLLRGVSDPLEALKKFKAKIQHSLNLVLRKNVLKFFLTMKIRMFQMDKDGNKKFASAGFYGGTHTLLRQS